MRATRADALRRFARGSLPEPVLSSLRQVRAWLRGADPRSLYRARRYRGWNREASADEMVLRPGLRFKVASEAREGFEHFVFRSPEMVDEMDAFLRARGTHRALLDIGACHGLFALAFTCGRPEARAVAVEPSLPARAVLERNLRHNPDLNVRVVDTALGAAPGSTRMLAEWHHLVVAAPGEGAVGGVEVALETADGLCARLDFAPDLVKIDVEGYEHAVLNGARRLVASGPTLFLEVHPERLSRLGSSVDALLSLLEDGRYAFETVSGDRVRRSDLTSMASVFRIVCRREAAQ